MTRRRKTSGSRSTRSTGTPPSGLQLSVETFEQLPDMVAECFKIQATTGGLVPLRFNHAQLELIKAIIRQVQANQPVRILVLKARQLGFTTGIQAILGMLALFNNNVTATTLAHTDPALQNDIAPIMQTYLREFPHPEGRIPTVIGTDSIKLLNGSRLRYATAGGKGVGRGGTNQMLHASEVAFWETGTASENKAALGVFSTVHAQPNTMIFMESTANGRGGKFYQTWTEAKAQQAGDWGEFIPLFFPWFAEPSYRLEVPPDFTRTYDEDQLVEEHGVSDEQLAWRRWRMRQPDIAGDLRKWNQEFPADDEAAFVFSGDPFFDPSSMDKYRQKVQVTIPKTRLTVLADPKDDPPQWSSRPDPRGALWVWEWPKQGVPYYIGADVAQGLPKTDHHPAGDNSVAQIVNGWTWEQAAEFVAPVRPVPFSAILYVLGMHYNMAWLGIEQNFNPGTAELVQRWGYPRLHYYHQTDHRYVKPQENPRVGWITNAKTREAILEHMRQAVDNGELGVQSERLVHECLSFLRQGKRGKPEAAEDDHDDTVMAMAIALEMIRLHPPPAREDREAQPATARQLAVMRELARDRQRRRRAEARNIWFGPNPGIN